MMIKPFYYNRRIYFADTDAGGIVYHANYLKFAEEARGEYLRSLNCKWSDFDDFSIVVSQANIKYKKPAKYDDLITVETILNNISKTRFYFSQNIKKDDVIIAEIELVVACVNGAGKPKRVPEIFHDLYKKDYSKTVY